MSHQLGFSRTVWNNYENERSHPSLTDFISIAKHFGVSEYELLHIDLKEMGNLNEGSVTPKKEEISNLNSNVKGNLNTKKQEKKTLLNLVDDKEKARLVNIRMPLVVTVDTQGNENVVLVPVRARAGYLNGYGDQKFIEKLPAYRLPGLNHGSYRLFEVEGLSMHPTLHGGDLVIGQNVEQLQDVLDDRIYVVITKNEGVVVKRCLNRLQKDGKLILKSDNYKDRDLYPPIVCNPEDILEIWYVTGFISRQMRPPSEMYNRVIDLEGRLTLMEEATRKKLK